MAIQPLLHPPNLPPSSSSTIASSALLSLLPPLPRAQALLQQTSILTSKLFDASPNRALWLSAFRGSLPSFLSSSHSLPPPPPLEIPNNPSIILSQFNSLLQTQLFEAVTELQEILDLQDAKQKVSREIKSRDSSLLAFANKLKEPERVLDMLVDDYSDYRKPKRTKTDDSTTTVSSQLKLKDIGLPKTVIEKKVEALIEPLPPPVETMNLQNLLPPNISVPSGWKPGMPVELPKDWPMPPPGWKPGDPVVIPPAPRAQEQQQQMRPPPPGLHRPPDVIQVRPVQLDILESDDSSDYGSDDASSDDE